MGKICFCGREMCPICKGKSTPLDGVSVPTVPKTRAFAFGKRSANAAACSASVAGDAPLSLTLKPGVVYVPCACGCGNTVLVGPVYFSSTCRSRVCRGKK